MGRKSWVLNIEGKDHQIIFNRALILGKSTLSIDNVEIPIPNNLYSNYIGYDLAIKIGEKEGRFVSLGSWADIAVDGKYIKSGKPYLPLEDFQWWSWIFVSLCVLAVIYSRIGSLSILIALFGIMWTLQVNVCPELSLGQKLLYSSLIVVGVYILSVGAVNLLLI